MEERGKNRLYNDIPLWMIRLLETKQCPRCKNESSRTDICAIGIREVKPVGRAWCIEHSCSKCDYRTITSFSAERRATVEELCYLLLEEKQKSKRIGKVIGDRPRDRTENISEAEFDEFKKFMKESETHADFMRFIGAREIEKMEEQDDES